MPAISGIKEKAGEKEGGKERKREREGFGKTEWEGIQKEVCFM